MAKTPFPLENVFTLWLSDGDLMWEVLSNVLGNQAVGFSYLAEKTREKSGKQE